ncbi:sensor histidine kinase [Isoalcanivorax beigongshangi]|uniref:histidine kinase n=1 Tax=Isoalcanivorax beigongshangi TaxID=3238810 RepID=A0ABV4AIX2_9GAMM
MSAAALALNSWRHLERAGAPLAQRAEALCRAAAAAPGIVDAHYLGWHVGSRTFRQLAGTSSLPPGLSGGPPASDVPILAQLQAHPSLPLTALRDESGWLSGRLRRAGYRHGRALQLVLEPGEHGLLLLHTGDQALDTDWLEASLRALQQEHPGAPPPLQLLPDDPQPILLLAADGTLRAANPAFFDLPGASRDGALGYLPVNHRSLVRACLQQRRAIGNVEADAGGRLFLWTFVPAPQHQTVLARGLDATDALQRDRDAVRARRLYRLITENTTDLISRHTPDGCFLDASPASWTLLGYWPEQLRGQYLHDLLDPDERDGFLARSREALEQDGYQTLTYRIRHRDGHYLWFETASRAIRETYTGDVVEIVSVSRDITARVQAEFNKRRLEDELAHAARLVTLGELASGIAHEINQPLAAVTNYAAASQRYLEQLPQQPQTERVAQGLAHIREYAQHASQVIQRLRAFLRKGARRMQALSVAAVAEEAVHLCAWEASHHDVTIEIDAAEPLPLVYADRVLLEQVLLNLLRNAIEANREAHPTSRSRVELAAWLDDSGDMLIEVRDQGPGLTGDDRNRIFTPFYTRKAEGLGLGLSMSRTIIEGFGGALDLADRPGPGLTFRCRLPVRRPHQYTETT